MYFSLFIISMTSIFTKIINGEIPSFKIYEDEHTFAFLDIRPVQPWHTLVVPKIEVDYFTDVPEPYYSAVFQTAQKIAPAIQKATGCKRICTTIIGYEVPHFHYHLVPTNSMDDMRTSPQEVSMDKLTQMHKLIMQYM